MLNCTMFARSGRFVGKKPIVVMLHIKKEQRRLQKHLMQEGLPHGSSSMYAAALGGRYPVHGMPGPVGAMEGPSSRLGPVGPMVGPLREQMYLQQQSLLGLGGDPRGQGLAFNRAGHGQGLGATMGYGGGNGGGNGGYNNHNHLAAENNVRGGYGRGNGGGGLNNDLHHNHNNGGSYRMGGGNVNGGNIHGMGGNQQQHRGGNNNVGIGSPSSSSSSTMYGANNISNKQGYEQTKTYIVLTQLSSLSSILTIIT